MTNILKAFTSYLGTKFHALVKIPCITPTLAMQKSLKNIQHSALALQDD